MQPKILRPSLRGGKKKEKKRYTSSFFSVHLGYSGAAMLNQCETNLRLRNKTLLTLQPFSFNSRKQEQFDHFPPHRPRTRSHVASHGRLCQNARQNQGPEKHERFSCSAHARAAADESATLDVTRYFDVQ